MALGFSSLQMMWLCWHHRVVIYSHLDTLQQRVKLLPSPGWGKCFVSRERVQVFQGFDHKGKKNGTAHFVSQLWLRAWAVRQISLSIGWFRLLPSPMVTKSGDQKNKITSKGGWNDFFPQSTSNCVLALGEKFSYLDKTWSNAPPPPCQKAPGEMVQQGSSLDISGHVQLSGDSRKDPWHTFCVRLAVWKPPNCKIKSNAKKYINAELQVASEHDPERLPWAFLFLEGMHIVHLLSCFKLQTPYFENWEIWSTFEK